MAKDSKEAAEAQFKKLQRAEDGAKAMAEYEAEVQAVRDRTAKLRALRLAKEAADKSAADTKAAVAPRKKSAKSKEKSVPLSDWLAAQQGSGRRT